VPFLLSVILIAVGLFVRLSIYESPAFSQVRESGTEARMPIVDVLRTYPKNVAIGVGSRIGIDAAFYILAFYSLDHIATNLGLSENVGLIGVTIAALIELFTIPLFASLSDRVGKKPLLLVSSAFLGVWVFPFFWLLNTKSTALIVVAIVIGLALGHAAVYGVQASFYAELFGTRVRYSGASFSYQISGIFGGAGTDHRHSPLPHGGHAPDLRLHRRRLRAQRRVLRPGIRDLPQGHLRGGTRGTAAGRRAAGMTW
jgi:MFS transporter, MHS family, shikimate and dehydroshikimate transport protein